MQLRNPSVYRIAETKVNDNALKDMLAELGAPDWDSDATSDAEALVEVSGRLCYQSFGTELNDNISRVRNGNAPYVKNVIKQRHGSVVEHPSLTYAFINVSRVFTHELVRHRHGSPSQESLRFVRTDRLSAYFPEIGLGQDTMLKLAQSLSSTMVDDKDPANTAKLNSVWAKNVAYLLHNEFTEVFLEAEARQRRISALLRLNECTDFDLKKKITSAMRRMLPDGMSTSIIYTTNHRALRDIIEKRTSRHAEEEIRVVFEQVWEDVSKDFPSLYADGKTTMVDGHVEVTFDNSRA